MTARINVTPGAVRGLLNSLGRITTTALITSDSLTAEEIESIAGLFIPWSVGSDVDIGDIRKYQSKIYKCVQSHTTQVDWTPDITPALWLVVSAPGIIPEWIQPTGSHDAYAIDDLVTHNSIVWKSTIAANTTVPGDNPEFDWWVEN